MKVTIRRLPETLEEFSSQMDLSRPENTCALLLEALALWLRDREAGHQALDLLRGPRPMLPYDRQFLRDRMRGKEYLARAYFEGAAPENGYTPHTPCTLTVLPDTHPAEPGYCKVFLVTAGADSPRPVTLRRKGDSWYLWEYSSILTGIRLPAAEDPWA